MIQETINIFDQTVPMVHFVFGLCFLSAYIFRIAHNFFLGRLALRKDIDKSEEEFDSISIIVPSRNSVEQLRKLMPQLLDQNYPNYEVVVINDCSEDETEDYLRLLQKTEPKLKVSFVRQETDFSNALVLTIGVRAASNNWLLFLDPHVELMSSSFLREYSHYLKQDKDVVYGYSNSNYRESFWGRLITLEYFILFVTNFAAWSVNATMPVHGINIAYRRQAFLDAKGFARNLDDRFAENELLANKLSKNGRVQLALRPTTITRSCEKLNKWDWMNLKEKQLLMKKKFYFGQKLYLSTNEWSRIVFDIAFLFLMIFSPFRWFALGIWGLNLIFHIIWIGIFQKKVYERNMIFQEPVYRHLLPVVNLYFLVKLKITASRKKWR